MLCYLVFGKTIQIGGNSPYKLSSLQTSTMSSEVPRAVLTSEQLATNLKS